VHAHAHGLVQLLEVYMTTEGTKRAYVAPTLERMSIGATANESALNGDVKPFVANTATLPES